MIRSALKVILAKVEATYGVDAVPSPTADAMLVENFSMTPLEGEELIPENVVRTSFGAEHALALAGRRVQVEFDVPLQGAGAAGNAPFWGTLMRGCGFAQVANAGVDVRYAPVTGGEESLTLECYRDGILHKALGCRGDWSFKLDAGGRLLQHFSYTGIYQPVADAAMPVNAAVPARTELPVDSVHTPTFALFGVSLALKSLEIKRANQVQVQNLVNDFRVDILGRKPEGSAVVREVPVATFNAWQQAEAGTTGALSLVHGTAAGSIVEIQCPNVQIGKPSISDENGISMLNLPLRIANTNGNANDDITVIVR